MRSISCWRKSKFCRDCPSRSALRRSRCSPPRNRPRRGQRHSLPTEPKPGEVWFADLGMMEKSRPVLVLAYPEPADARALAIVAPLTSQIRGLRGEVPLGKPRWLPKVSAVNVQGLASFDPCKLARRLGALPVEQYGVVKEALRDLLR